MKKAKVEYVMTLVARATDLGDKVLLFAGYHSTLDRLADALGKLFPSMYIKVVDGRQSPDDRQLIIDEFSKQVGAAVLLLSPEATGVGLNITAANHVIHFSPMWNPAKTAQATARVYRRKQNKPVFVHYLYYVDTVEERVMSRSDFKRQLAEEVHKGISDGGD